METQTQTNQTELTNLKSQSQTLKSDSMKSSNQEESALQNAKNSLPAKIIYNGLCAILGLAVLAGVIKALSYVRIAYKDLTKL